MIVIDIVQTPEVLYCLSLSPAGHLLQYLPGTETNLPIALVGFGSIGHIEPSRDF